MSDQLISRPRKADAEQDDMDMTPMVDVTFLLLIFFMITAAFALQKAMDVPPVEDDEAAPTQVVEEIEEDTVVVRLDEDNIYWIDAPIFEEEQKAVSRQDMREAVRKAREGKGGKFGKGPGKLLVQAHGDATHEYMVAGLDAGAAEGVRMKEIRLRIYEDGDL
ncbi:MAG: biopolymer transporter ExbD [Planctomycetota bacterium]